MIDEAVRVRKRKVKGGKGDFDGSSDEEIDPYGDRNALRVQNENVKRPRNNSHFESEEEDVFHLRSHPVKNESDDKAVDEEQRARFAKHQEYLEQLRISRMEALQSQQQQEEQENDKEDEKRSEQKHTESKESAITSEQFNLMQKTAEALQGAANRSILEARIFANHGNDARFAFLKRTADDAFQPPSRLLRTWQALKEGKVLTLEAANADTNSPLNNLVAYESSEEEDEINSEKQANNPTSKIKEHTPIAEEDAETKRKRRLQLAHEWSRKKQEERLKKEATDIITGTSHTHST
ncbi:hypothetical protein L7F22_042265 [Adiantum nelumboides]|nr:hypothetical protein [Adiantum nelumboides]